MATFDSVSAYCICKQTVLQHHDLNFNAHRLEDEVAVADVTNENTACAKRGTSPYIFSLSLMLLNCDRIIQIQ